MQHVSLLSESPRPRLERKLISIRQIVVLSDACRQFKFLSLSTNKKESLDHVQLLSSTQESACADACFTSGVWRFSMVDSPHRKIITNCCQLRRGQVEFRERAFMVFDPHSQLHRRICPTAMSYAGVSSCSGNGPSWSSIRIVNCTGDYVQLL